MSLKEKVKTSLLWSLVDNVFLKGFTFFVNIFLARMLSPNDFGLVGIVTIFVVLGNAITEGGMGNSIIRDLDADEQDYNSVFLGNLFVSIILYPILFILAPFVATLFHVELLEGLIKVYGVVIVLSAFYNVQYAILLKQMRFKKITMINLPAVLIGSALGLYLAYNGYTVWSLVYLHIATILLKIILHWIFSSWKPSLNISWRKLKKHFNFGYKLMLSSLIDVGMREVYSFLIGKKFSISTLGFYNQAKSIKNQPVTLINVLVNNISYPLLSQIQNDKERVSRNYGHIIRCVFFLIVPVMFSLGVVAKPLFIVLFTEKWLPSVPYFQLLILSSVLFPIHSLNINVFKIYDRTDLFLKLEIVKVVLTLMSLVCGYIWGIYGLLLSMVAISYLALFINTFYSKKLINYSTWDQIKDMGPVLFIGFLSSGICYVLLGIINNVYISIFVSIMCFYIVYILFFFLFNKVLLMENISFLVRVLKKNKV